MHWVEKTTVDGALYYHNPALEKVSWDKPNELKTPEELATDTGDWVWVRDAKEAWLPARVESQTADRVAVKFENGRQATVTQSADEPLWRLTASQLTHLKDDMVMLDSLNEAMMVHDVRERYKKDEIYTWVGASHTVLVAVNPFQRLPLYVRRAAIPLMHRGAAAAGTRLFL